MHRWSLSLWLPHWHWLLVWLAGAAAGLDPGTEWLSASQYPDIRGHRWHECGPHVPSPDVTGFDPYVCDPNRVLNASDLSALNNRLHLFSVSTYCKCHRRSQCTGVDHYGKQYQFGFVAAVAVVHDLKMDVTNPRADELRSRADQFARTLRNRWALGDCGNSAIVFLWIRYRLMIVSAGRVAQQYLTARDTDVIIKHVQRYLAASAYKEALLNVIDNVEAEFNGEPEERVDIGTLSLVLTVAIALFFVLIVTGCVCAFRCCGNLNPQHAGKSLVKEATLAGGIDPFRMGYINEELRHREESRLGAGGSGGNMGNARGHTHSMDEMPLAPYRLPTSQSCASSSAAAGASGARVDADPACMQLRPQRSDHYLQQQQQPAQRTVSQSHSHGYEPRRQQQQQQHRLMRLAGVSLDELDEPADSGAGCSGLQHQQQQQQQRPVAASSRQSPPQPLMRRHLPQHVLPIDEPGGVGGGRSSSTPRQQHRQLHEQPRGAHREQQHEQLELHERWPPAPAAVALAQSHGQPSYEQHDEQQQQHELEPDVFVTGSESPLNQDRPPFAQAALCLFDETTIV